LTIFDMFKPGYLVNTGVFPSNWFSPATVSAVNNTDIVYDGQDFIPILPNLLMTPFLLMQNLIGYFFKLQFTKSWIPPKLTTLGEEAMVVVMTVRSQQLTFAQMSPGFQLNLFYTQLKVNTYMPVSNVAAMRSMIYMYKCTEEFTVIPYPYLSDGAANSLFIAITQYASDPTNDSALNKVIQTGKGFDKADWKKSDFGGHQIGLTYDKVSLLDLARKAINAQLMQGTQTTFNFIIVKWSKKQMRMRIFDASFQGNWEFLNQIGNFAKQAVGATRSAVNQVYHALGPVAPIAESIANQFLPGLKTAMNVVRGEVD